MNSFGPANGVDRAFTTAPCAATPIKGTVYALNGRYPFTNLIYGYGVTNAGALIQLPGFPLLNGVTGDDDTSAPEQLTYDAAKKRLYAINGTLGTLSVFNVDNRTGALTPAPFSPIVLAGGVVWTTVHVHPSGSPVVVGGIVGGFDNPAATGQVASYVITPTTATMAAGSPFAAGGASPFSCAFSRDGNYLLRRRATSVPTRAPRDSPWIPRPACSRRSLVRRSVGRGNPVGYATDAAGRLFTSNFGTGCARLRRRAGYRRPSPAIPLPRGLDGGVHGLVHPLGFYMVADRTANRSACSRSPAAARRRR